MNISDYCKGIQHLGIPTDSIDDTVAFYKRIGFSVALSTFNEKSKEKVEFLQNGNLMLEIYENHKPCLRAGAIDHMSIDVTDIEKVFAYVKNNNFNMLDTEIQFLPFWKNGMRFFTIIGPNEEKIEFSQIL